ncbi:hypothetical protein GV828_01285 [Flavobacterium sp. NST-5]|uniref:Lipocalin-like domain-containing protein n=1 Tax=Flavobacterium ichthyis TaxID=2698827 RepID=A0ABW9Z4R9_9FLAO|nr:lipocalin family protein [Flavobacterium ichthyis]NBL63827.1 hypothetical protein [Flavobacterium ichthyis]
MRKFLFLLALTAFSCSSDDNNSSNENGELDRTRENIVGNWIIKGGTINGGAFQNYENECATKADYQQILINGNLNFVGHDETCEVREFETTTWSISGNNFIVDNEAPFNDSVYEIDRLTSDEMILSITYNDGGTLFSNVLHYEKQ